MRELEIVELNSVSGGLDSGPTLVDRMVGLLDPGAVRDSDFDGVPNYRDTFPGLPDTNQQLPFADGALVRDFFSGDFVFFDRNGNNTGAHYCVTAVHSTTTSSSTLDFGVGGTPGGVPNVNIGTHGTTTVTTAVDVIPSTGHGCS